MGLFSRKEEPPKITPTPILPEIPRKEKSSEDKISELPTFPVSKNNDSLNEDMIKSAMDGETSPEMNLPEDDIDEEEIRTRIPKPPIGKPRPPMRGKPQRETIYVKIDKFNQSKESLGVIQEKVHELSVELQELKDIKVQEAKELTIWDEELKKINLRLSRIDTSIFGEV